MVSAASQGFGDAERWRRRDHNLERMVWKGRRPQGQLRADGLLVTVW